MANIFRVTAVIDRNHAGYCLLIHTCRVYRLAVTQVVESERKSGYKKEKAGLAGARKSEKNVDARWKFAMLMTQDSKHYWRRKLKLLLLPCPNCSDLESPGSGSQRVTRIFYRSPSWWWISYKFNRLTRAFRGSVESVILGPNNKAKSSKFELTLVEELTFISPLLSVLWARQDFAVLSFGNLILGGWAVSRSLSFTFILCFALLLADIYVGLWCCNRFRFMYTHLSISFFDSLVGSLSVLLGSQLVHLSDALLELVVLALLVGVSLLLVVC